MKRPTGKHEVHDFPATILNPGTADAQKVHLVACTSSGCTEVLSIPANGTTGPYGMPKDAVIRKATQAKWLVRRKGRSITCPACQGHIRPMVKAAAAARKAPAPDPSPVQTMPKSEHAQALGEQFRRDRGRVRQVRTAPATPAELYDIHAAFDGGDLAAPVEVYVPAPDHPHPQLERCVVHVTPRSAPDEYDALADARYAFAAGDIPGLEVTWTEQPTFHPAAAAALSQDALTMDTTTTPALRRAINARLHEVHAGDSGYLADWSDAKVAKGLDCSPAAVAAIREDLFGPDTNEEQRRAAVARDTELAAIRRQLVEGAGKVDQSMATLAEADRLYADALARLAKLEGKN